MLKHYHDFIKEKQITENFSYHIYNQIPLNESVFRIGSEAFVNLFREARKYRNLLENEIDIWLVENTDIGEWGIYNEEYVPLDIPFEKPITEAKGEYQGKEVELEKPKKNSSGDKPYMVYVKNPDSGEVNKVEFGSSGLKSKIGDKKAAKNFASRHNCDEYTKKDKLKPGYWSCNLPKYAKALGLSEPAYKYW